MRKWLKRIVLGLLVIALTGWLSITWLLRKWTAKPPPLPSDTAIMQLKPQERDGKVWLGHSWVGRREGLLVVYLKGAPFELGYANGVLMQPQIHTLENEGDQIWREAVGELFERSDDAIEIVKWKDIHSLVEVAIDRCEDVANIVETITVKHS